jgi:hypothetical protein
VPQKLESVLDRMDRDDLQVDAALRDPEDQFERLAKRVVLGVVFASGVVSTTLLWIADQTTVAVLGATATAVVGYLLYRSFQTGVDLYADSDAQFTRQRLDDGGGETAMGLGEDPTEGSNDPATHEDMPTPGNVEEEMRAGTSSDAASADTTPGGGEKSVDTDPEDPGSKEGGDTGDGSEEGGDTGDGSEDREDDTADVGEDGEDDTADGGDGYSGRPR